MPTFAVNEKIYDVDEDGFLQEPGIWNEEVARDFATSEGVGRAHRESLEGDQLSEELLISSSASLP